MSIRELMNIKDGREIVEKVFNMPYKVFIGLKGLDKKPWIYSFEAPKEINGVFWWLCDKSTLLSGSLSLNPEIQLFIEDEEGVVFRLTGKAEFSEDEAIISKCLRKDMKQEYQIALRLKDARLTITDGLDSKSLAVKQDDAGFAGVTIKKDREIKERLAKILEERSERKVSSSDFQKLYDGVLLALGESAKKLWPSFNLMPLESTLLYDTYDERENYQNKAMALLGSITIKQVEDLTYYTSEETVKSLL